MATVNEQIATGRKFRKLIDEVNKIWLRISFWTKAIDVEFNDGNNAETKFGAINGVTDSLTSTASNIAASAKAVKTLNDKVTQLSSNIRTNAVLLWSNPNPDAGFGAQTIQKDLSKYDAVIIAVKRSRTDSYVESYQLVKIPTSQFYLVGSITNTTRPNNSIDTSKINFTSNGAANDGYTIPVKVWGIKLVMQY